MSKPSLPKGTRDFGPADMAKRNYIFSIITSVFEKYGFMPLETPAMEGLQTLTGKYGEEGDQLIFKILNNGDFLKKADKEALQREDSKKLSFSLSKKALRYDLTVPFARYVVMNRSEIAMPFKRYQIQPVWRGDKPGKGRYQEFYQCDADVVGSDSLLNEADLARIFDEVLTSLKLEGVVIKLNNRKILSALALWIGREDDLTNLTIAIDKLDKVGIDGVEKELVNRGFASVEIEKVKQFLAVNGSIEEKLDWIAQNLDSDEARLGVAELKEILAKVELTGLKGAKLDLDLTLARGLNYYTGAIFEVIVENSGMGSICGGGRYDDLTGIFGWQGVSGVGISFGAERIMDILNERELYPSDTVVTTQVMCVNFGEEEEKYCVKLAAELRDNNIKTEVYPESAKMKKQMSYADAKGIPYVLLIGSNEIESGNLTLKNLESGEQKQVTKEELINLF
ncbi:MAG: histidine--tRNA ligase [Flavobacteriales bacterium]